MFQFVSICSSRSTCLGSTRLFRLYLVVMVRYVLFFEVISIVLCCFRCVFHVCVEFLIRFGKCQFVLNVLCWFWLVFGCGG